MYRKPIASWLKHLDFIIVDLLALNLSFLIAYFYRFSDKKVRIGYLEPIYLNIILVLCLGQLAISLMVHTHDKIIRRGIYREIFSIFLLSVCDLAFATLYLFSLKIGVEYSRIVIYLTIGIFFIIDTIFRLIWKECVIFLQNKFSLFKEIRPVFILTEKKHALSIIKDIVSDKFSNFSIEAISLVDSSKKVIAKKEILSFIKGTSDDDSFEKNINTKLENLKFVEYKKATDYIVRAWIDEIFVYLPEHNVELIKFLAVCREMGLTVHLILDVYKISENRRFVENFGEHTVITTANNSVEIYQLFVKRLMDIVGGTIGVIITGLLYLFVAPRIKKESEGPAIYKQVRIGKNGKRFTMYKFRSMYLDADKNKNKYLKQNKMNGKMFKLEFDPRIIGNNILPDGTKVTGIGQFIRKTSIDEFPQFINVLKGDMSLVGTRPPTIDEWEKYEYHHRARLSWKPGITGLWQVSGRNAITDFEKVVELDTEYICNFKLTTDIKIIFKTILKLFRCEGM